MLPNTYIQIQSESGQSLAAINPGSEEIALPRLATVEALTTLTGMGIAVLGGDVLTKKNGSLEYVYANWSCSKKDNESFNDYAVRSLQLAVSYVSNFTPAYAFEPLFVCVLKMSSKA